MGGSGNTAVMHLTQLIGRSNLLYMMLRLRVSKGSFVCFLSFLSILITDRALVQ